MAPERIGKYPIERRLGSGGMGSLYLARHPSLDHRVAIKILKDDYQDDPELRERFVREARSAARLKHDNIVVVHDYVVDEGQPFIVMEYIEGETLAKRLRERPPLSLDHRLALVEALCSGLAHAHAEGIVHRDIKPANLMLDRRGVLKILDFGIARLGNSGMTLEGMMMGSVNYMSPEQVVGRGVDHRTDIFAAGAVLYEVIALEQAFPGGIDGGVLNRVLHEGHTPLTAKVPDVDPELSEIVDRALQRDVERRYQSAEEMRRDVSRVRRRLNGGQPDQTMLSRRDEFSPVGPARIAALKQQQIEEYLTQSEQAFAQGDFESAQRYAERAIAVDATHRPALDSYDRARFAGESIRVKALVERALNLLSEGRFDEAEASIRDASVTLPHVPGASSLGASVRDVAVRIDNARERERRISASLDRARTSLESGSFDTALRAVYEVLSLDPERSEARELELLAKERLQERRELERAERNARSEVRRARELLSKGLHHAAEAMLSAIESPSDAVRAEIEEASSAVRQARHQAAVAAVIATARDHVRAQRFAEGLAALADLAAADVSAEARQLRDAANDGIRLQEARKRQQQALETGLVEVQARINSRELVRALEQLEAVARIGLEDERIAVLRGRIAELRTLEEQRQQREARDRQATRRVEAARQLVAQQQLAEAIALLERHEVSHPLVEQALAEIRQQLAEQQRLEAEARRRREEEEQRREAERQRRAEEERLQRQAEADRQREAAIVTALERAAAAASHEDALRILSAAPSDARIAEAQTARADALERERVEARRREDEAERAREAERVRQAELARQREEAERRRVEAERAREAEAARQRREAEARKRAEEERAREEAKARRQAEAERARQEAEAARRAEEERKQAEEERTRVEEERKRQEAEAARQREEEESRRQEAQAAREREAQRLAEEQRQAEIRTRQEEEERRRQEEETRLREEAVTVVVTRVRMVSDHHAALKQLRELDTIAPNDTQVKTLIRERERALEAEAAARAAREAAEAAERARKERIERDRRAAEVVEEANRLFADGQHAGALSLLREAESHPAVGTALPTLEARLRALERERALEARRVRRAAMVATLRRTASRAEVRVATILVVVAAVAIAALQMWPRSEPEVPIAGPVEAPAVATPPAPAAPAPEPSAPTPGPAPAPPPPGPMAPSPAGPAGVRAGGAAPIARGATTPDPGRGTVSSPGTGGTTTQPTTGGANQPVAPPPVQPTLSPAGGAQNPPAGEGQVQAPQPLPRQQPETPQPPQPQPVPVPTVNVAAERSAIRELVNRYVAAFESMDERRIRAIDPSYRGLDPRSRVLLRSRNLALSDESIEIADDGQSARFTAIQNVTNIWNRAEGINPPPSRLSWKLIKVDGVWRVQP